MPRVEAERNLVTQHKNKIVSYRISSHILYFYSLSLYTKQKNNKNELLCIVTRLISDVHFHKTGPKLTFKTYNYRHCDTSMSPKTANYFPSGGVIATLPGNCKVLCYANMNVTLFQVSANQRSIYGLYIISAPFFGDLKIFQRQKITADFIS